jgi:hypothetical protein
MKTVQVKISHFESNQMTLVPLLYSSVCPNCNTNHQNKTGHYPIRVSANGSASVHVADILFGQSFMTSSSARGQHKQSLLTQSVFLRLLLIAVALGSSAAAASNHLLRQQTPAGSRRTRSARSL